MFLEGRWRAAALNTTHRFKSGSEGVDADLAHLEESYFQAFTRAWCLVGGGPLVQLHGYVKEKRKSVQARSADIILSSGVQTAQPLAHASAARLARAGCR